MDSSTAIAMTADSEKQCSRQKQFNVRTLTNYTGSAGIPFEITR